MIKKWIFVSGICCLLLIIGISSFLYLKKMADEKNYVNNLDINTTYTVNPNTSRNTLISSVFLKFTDNNKFVVLDDRDNFFDFEDNSNGGVTYLFGNYVRKGNSIKLIKIYTKIYIEFEEDYNGEQNNKLKVIKIEKENTNAIDDDYILFNEFYKKGKFYKIKSKIDVSKSHYDYVTKSKKQVFDTPDEVIDYYSQYKVSADE